MPDCLSSCCQELSKRSPADFDAVAIHKVFDLPPGLHDLAAFADVVVKATDALLVWVGDAEAVCNAWYDESSDLDQRLLQLTQPALLALLKSGQLWAHSENSVLLMADAWVRHGEAAGVAHSPAQLQQVAGAVRMCQLGLPFLCSSPEMSWGKVDSKERDSLWLHAALSGGARSKSYADACKQACSFSGPASWFNATPRGAATPLVVKWELPREQLSDELGKASKVTNGYWIENPRCYF